MPTAAADPLARRGFSRSASSTYWYKYACVVLTCEKPRRASGSAASQRHSLIIPAGGGRSGPLALLLFLPAAATPRGGPPHFFVPSADRLVAVPPTSGPRAGQFS